MIIETFFLFLFLILIAIFLLSERADLTASVSLQGIRGEGHKIRVWLVLVQIFNAIPRTLFSAFSYLQQPQLVNNPG